MARTGRPPKPAALKKLQGNPGKRKIVPDAAPPMKGAADADELARSVAALPVPPPPKHLAKIAAEEWRRLAKLMVSQGTLRELDRAAFEVRCQTYERLVIAQRALRKGLTYQADNGRWLKKPEVSIVENCEKAIKAFDTEFGLTPAARARVRHVTGGVEQPNLFGKPAAPAQPQPAQPQQQPAPPADSAPPKEPPPPGGAVVDLNELDDDKFFAGPKH